MGGGAERRKVVVMVLGVAVVVAVIAVVAWARTSEPRSTTVAASSGTAADGEQTTTTEPSLPATTVVDPQTLLTTAPPRQPAPAAVAPSTTTTVSAPTSAPLTCDSQGGLRASPGTDLVAVGTADGLHEIGADGTGDFVVPGSLGDRRYSSATWDAPGDRVAYVTHASGGYASSVVVVDLSKGCWRPVTPADDRANDDPGWSPDGRIGYRHFLAGAGFDPAKAQIDATNVEDLRTATVVEHATSGPTWAPDGSGRIAFSDGEGLKTFDPSTRRTTLLHAASSAEFPVWSPDASQLVFSISVDSAVWLVRADGVGGAHKISPPELWQIFWTSWSPDGKSLAFTGSRRDRTPTSDRSASDLWVMDADGGNARAVTTSGRASGKPRWSPDGRRLAYESVASTSPGPLTTSIEIIDVDGTNRRVVVSDAHLFGFLRRAG